MHRFNERTNKELKYLYRIKITLTPPTPTHHQTNMLRNSAGLFSCPLLTMPKKNKGQGLKGRGEGDYCLLRRGCISFVHPTGLFFRLHGLYLLSLYILMTSINTGLHACFCAKYDIQYIVFGAAADHNILGYDGFSRYIRGAGTYSEKSPLRCS